MSKYVSHQKTHRYIIISAYQIIGIYVTWVHQRIVYDLRFNTEGDLRCLLTCHENVDGIDGRCLDTYQNVFGPEGRGRLCLVVERGRVFKRRVSVNLPSCHSVGPWSSAVSGRNVRLRHVVVAELFYRYSGCIGGWRTIVNGTAEVQNSFLLSDYARVGCMRL